MTDLIDKMSVIGFNVRIDEVGKLHMDNLINYLYQYICHNINQNVHDWEFLKSFNFLESSNIINIMPYVYLSSDNQLLFPAGFWFNIYSYEIGVFYPIPMYQWSISYGRNRPPYFIY